MDNSEIKTLTEIINSIDKKIIHNLMYDGICYVTYVFSEMIKKGYDVKNINEERFPIYIMEHYDSNKNYMGDIVKNNDINISPSNSIRLTLKGYIDINNGEISEIYNL